MKLDNSNKRYSNYIAGILVFILLFILMGFLIGCWGCSTNEKVGAPSVFPLDSNFNTGNINREPAAQGPETWNLDTVRGTLTVTDAGFYNDNGDLIVNMTAGFLGGQFPLCIDVTDGYYFNFTVKTTGGYSPYDDIACNYIEILQWKWSANVYNKYKLTYNANDWIPALPDGCFDVWEGIIPVIDDDDHELYIRKKVDCHWTWVETDCMTFESNHAYDCSGTLCKEVDVKLKTLWSGCRLPEQSFCCVRNWDNLDTECGEMIIMPYGIYDSSTFLFDLCYEPGDVIGTIYLSVKGGYRPCDEDIFTISQIKTGSVYSVYKLDNITWAPYELSVHGEIDSIYHDECCEEVFVGTINFVDEVILINDDGTEVPKTVMKLASNHPPLGCYPYCEDLNKMVTVTFESKWEGCCLTSQEFTYMLVHKNNISGVPNSRNFIAS